MSFPSWLTDRLIFQPTRHTIQVPGRKPLLFPHGNGVLEIWVYRVGSGTQAKPSVYLLEFPGTASRAEHRTDFLEECWMEPCVEIWAVNPPGYGNSTGSASLKKLPAMAEHALQEVQHEAGDVPVIVAGGSLGSVSALYLAAHHPVAGLLLQNPPALRELILDQSGWWHFKWAARIIAKQIPSELDSIANARKATVPAIFVSAQQDRIVQPRIQRQIFEAYKGPYKVFAMPVAGHATPLTVNDLEQLRILTHWMYVSITGNE